MDNGFHVIAGLPRSGSTLLSALLGQNPAFHTSISTPALDVLSTVKEWLGSRNDAATNVTDKQREAIFRGIMDAFYADVHPGKTVFDTNRYWCAYTDLLTALYPGAKIIACIRHVEWIVDSIERVVRSNPWRASKMDDPRAFGNVYTRTSDHLGESAVIGAALSALKQAYYRIEPDKIILVDYNSIASEPEGTLRLIYDFVGMPYFGGHYFENIEFSSGGYDDRLGTPGLHTVRKSVSLERRDSILPPDLFHSLKALNFWDHRTDLRSGVRII